MPRSDADSPKFRPGDCVRVKQAITDFDYADMLLGGWTGTVVEVEAGDSTKCLIRWSPETVQAMPSRYRARCEADGIDSQEKWLDQDDLEWDEGGDAPGEESHGPASPGHAGRSELDGPERWHKGGDHRC